MDYWTRKETPPFLEMIELARNYGLDVIVTVRDPEEGGVWSPPWRGEAYEMASEAGAVCDVEVKKFKELPCDRAILSVHYFRKPPREGEVRKLSQRALEAGAWAFKVATVVTDFPSYFLLFSESVHPRTAFMPMGEGTEALRLASALLGSFLNYGSVGEATAPGQVSVRQLTKALSALGGRGD